MPSKQLNTQELKNIANEYLQKHPLSTRNQKNLRQHLIDSKKLGKEEFARYKISAINNTKVTVGQLEALDLLNKVEELEESNNKSADACAKSLLSSLKELHALSKSDTSFGDAIVRALEDHYDIEVNWMKNSAAPLATLTEKNKGVYRNPIRQLTLQEYLKSKKPHVLCEKFKEYSKNRCIFNNKTKYDADEFISAVKSELLRAAKNGEINENDIPDVKDVLAHHANSKTNFFASKIKPITTIKTQAIKRSLEDIEIFTNLYCNKLLTMSYKELVTKYNEIKKGDNGLYGNSKNQSLKAIKHVLMNKLENEKEGDLGVSVSKINEVIDHHTGNKKLFSTFGVETASRKRVNKNNMLKLFLTTEDSTKNNTFNHKHSMFEL